MTKGGRTEVSLMKGEVQADLVGLSKLAEILLKQTATPNVVFPCRRNFWRIICKRWLPMWLRFIRSLLQKLSRTRWVCDIQLWALVQLQSKEQPLSSLKMLRDNTVNKIVLLSKTFWSWLTWLSHWHAATNVTSFIGKYESWCCHQAAGGPWVCKDSLSVPVVCFPCRWKTSTWALTAGWAARTGGPSPVSRRASTSAPTPTRTLTTCTTAALWYVHCTCSPCSPQPHCQLQMLPRGSFASGSGSCFKIYCMLSFSNACVICVCLLLSAEDRSSSSCRTHQKGDGSDPSYKIPPFCKDTWSFGEAWPEADQLFLGEGWQ